MNNINLHRVNRPLNHSHIKDNSTQTKARSANSNSLSFKNTLENVESRNLKFSKHAQARMDKRNLVLDKNDLKSLERALDKSEKKGVKEALIIMKDQAFIASVENKTIITAITNDQLKENIFTNIDGAIII